MSWAVGRAVPRLQDHRVAPQPGAFLSACPLFMHAYIFLQIFKFSSADQNMHVRFIGNQPIPRCG